MKNISGRFALGTVQFGLDYGISNTRGQVPYKEALNILKLCFESGISTIDTAFAYGDSEKVLGKILKENPGLKFSVISKFPKCDNNSSLVKYINDSVSNLGLSTLYGYLAHDTDSIIKNPSLWDELVNAMEENLISKIGISVYYPSQVEWFLERNIGFDLVQLPYNIFDNRFAYLFDELKQKNVEIHVRSVFLQGLVFIQPSSLHQHFYPVREKLVQLRELSDKMNIPLNSLLICYVFLNLKIDKIVMGVDSVDNLNANLKALEYIEEVLKVRDSLSQFNINDESILLPFNWPRT